MSVISLSPERYNEIRELLFSESTQPDHYGKVDAVPELEKFLCMLMHKNEAFPVRETFPMELWFTHKTVESSYKINEPGRAMPGRHYLTQPTDLQYKREQARLEGVIDAFFGTHGGYFVNSYDVVANGKNLYTYYHRPHYSINVFRLFKELGVTICGGTILSLFTESKVNDIDLYVKEPSNIPHVTAFLDMMFSNKDAFYSINAVTFKRRVKHRVYTVQLITKFTGEPEEIFEYFDFTITNACFDFTTGKFVFGERFFADLGKRVLVYAGKSYYPICALHRINKYMARGFRVPGATLMHIALAIVQLKIENYRQLKEQLMGIDTSYLRGLLEAKDPDVPVNYGEFIQEALDAISHIATTINVVDGVEEYEGDDEF